VLLGMLLLLRARMGEKRVRRGSRMTLEPNMAIEESCNSGLISATYAVRRGSYLRHVQCRVSPAYTRRPIGIEHLFPASEGPNIPQK
jgi:hypothetical protein